MYLVLTESIKSPGNTSIGSVHEVYKDYGENEYGFFVGKVICVAVNPVICDTEKAAEKASERMLHDFKEQI